MKKIIIFLSIILFLSACQKPDYESVKPGVDRAEITSLSAFFTSGPYVNEELVNYKIENPKADEFVIPVPWFYPEDSENLTTSYMTALRVRAELGYSCKLDPPLTVLDLNVPNKFTLTNAQGESRPIIIRGERRKSSDCSLTSFCLNKPYRVDGFVNDETDEIWIFTNDDIKGFTAEAVPSAHATVKTNLTIKKDYNQEQEVTVLAHDGVTSRTYKITKQPPTKIPYGIRDNSIRQLFNFNPVTRLNLPVYTIAVWPSLAYVDGSLIVCLGNGDTPIYIDGLTGVAKGNVSWGDVTPAAITNDEGGNVLITNHAEPGSTLEIYKTGSVSDQPVLLHSFANETDVPLGYNIKAIGNIDTEAVIIVTYEGVTGSTMTSKYHRIVISAGAVVSCDMIDLSGLAIGWGAAPASAAKVVPVSTNPDDGVMLSYYEPYPGNAADIRNSLKYVNGKGVIAATLPIFEVGSNDQSNYNTNVIDTKTFNKTTYAVHLVSSFFPNWSCGPQLRLFDISSPTSIKDGKPIYVEKNIEYDAPNTYVVGYAAADVVMASSNDGIKVFVYYYDQHAGVIGGYVGDCINI